MDKVNTLDFGGLDVIVRSIKQADKPNQEGSDIELTAGELVITGGANDVTIPGTVAAAGTGAGSAGHTGGAVATHVLAITVGATPYYIPLCATNA